MALPRYDLYGDPTRWLDNIKQTEQGQWYRAKDIGPILEQFVAMGGVIPDALYPEGEAHGSRPSYRECPTVSNTGGAKLFDNEYTTEEYGGDFIHGVGGCDWDPGDGKAGVLSADGSALRDSEEDD